MVLFPTKLEKLYSFVFCIYFVTIKSKSAKRYRLFRIMSGHRVEILQANMTENSAISPDFNNIYNFIYYCQIPKWIKITQAGSQNHRTK